MLTWDNLITQHGGRGALLLIHGQPKVGKSTFAAMSPRPIVLMTESGLGRTEALKNVPAFPIDSWAAFVSAWDLLSASLDRFDTVVIDSIDHLEHRIAEVVAALNQVDSINKIGFNKGPGFVGDYVKVQLIPRLRWMQDNGKTIIMIAHSDAVSEAPPDQVASYKRWVPKLYKPVIELLKEEADIIGFATRPVITAEGKQGGFSGGPVKAVGIGDRRLYVQPGGAYLAGSRYDTAGRDWINLEWPEMKAIIDGTMQPPA